MPFSDLVPPIVYPDTYEGRQDARRHHQNGLDPYFCSEYRRDTDLSGREAMELRGATKSFRAEDVNLCANRNATGDRAHNWCFRCPAGFILVKERMRLPDPEF